MATQHAPGTQFIINQHLGMHPTAWNKIKSLVAYWRAEGLRVDGFGWQAHIDTGFENQAGNMEHPPLPLQGQ